MFKFQQPSDLISRMYILEYMREITAETIYNKADKNQKENFFYKFIDDDGKEQIDFNWEYSLFKSTMFELEKLMERVTEEVEFVEKNRKIYLELCKERLITEELSKPVDVNLMDLAKAAIESSRGKIIGS